MIGDNKAMWCGVEIMKDPDTNLTWSYWNNRWFVLSGPDPRTNEWDKSRHYWNPMEGPPRYYTFAAQREREDGGFDDAQPQEGASALADGTPLAEGGGSAGGGGARRAPGTAGLKGDRLRAALAASLLDLPRVHVLSSSRASLV